MEPDPLILSKEKNLKPKHISNRCGGCLPSSTYSCNKCKFLPSTSHAELLKRNNIISLLHPRHPLTLVEKSCYDVFSLCDHCNEFVYGFAYSCSSCKFNLHIPCASHHIFEPEGHKHSFMLLKQASFTCDACGEQSDDMSHLCTTCQLQVHKTCSASFPLVVKQIGHHHPLSLTYCIQMNDTLDKSCRICNREMKTEFCFYYCASCTYIAHVRCATLIQDLTDEPPDPATTTKDLMSDDSPNPNPEPNLPEIQHISHHHYLTLINDELEGDEEVLCDGCVQSISVPFYNCAQCNFFLHKSCVELPKKILHPLHTLPLTLCPPGRTHCLFKCIACSVYCNGLFYSCAKGNFSIDIRCSSFTNTLRHEGHEHTLILFKDSSNAECSACGLGCRIKFRCEECSFNLDLRCASLPYTTKHKWDGEPPAKLTYNSIENKLGEYYCDICEKRRNPSHWFYHGEYCDFSAHPTCIIGKHHVKFGKTIEDYDRHPHPLTLVEKSRKEYPHFAHPKCAICGKPCKDLVFKCAECNYYIHGACHDQPPLNLQAETPYAI